MGWTIRVQFLVGATKGFSLFPTTFRPVLGPTHPPIQWALEALSLKVKQLGHEADHSPLSSAKVKNA
jgi:hypothetical protein